MTTKSVVYTKIGENRGELRFWIEGRKVERGGISAGDRYRLESEGQTIRMRFTPDGDRVVSRRKRGDSVLPLIEVKGKHLQDAFRADDRVRVVVKPDFIEITLHHMDRSVSSREARFLKKIESGEPLSIGSICHGGGVLSHALHEGLSQAGVPTRLAFANEIDENYLDCSIRNNPVWSEESIAVNGPMQQVEWQHLPKVEILEAGIPCTGASLSGRAKNSLKFAEAHETAGSLFIAFLNAVQVLKPAVIVLENVPPYENTISYFVIKQVLQELDYVVSDDVLSGRDYGAFENRKRLCMVAVSKGLPPVDLSLIEKSPMDHEVLGDHLDPVPDDDALWKPYDYLRDKEQRDLAAGKGFKRQLLTPDAREVGTIGRGYSKARSTEPFLVHPTNPDLSRLLTVNEHASVKSIPANLVEGQGFTRGHEILGQSVVHAAFLAVGKLIGQSLQSCSAGQLAVA